MLVDPVGFVRPTRGLRRPRTTRNLPILSYMAFVQWQHLLGIVQGKSWRLRGVRTLLLDEAIEDRARRASREHVVTTVRAGFLSAARCSSEIWRFRATKIGGAFCTPERLESGSDPMPHRHAAGGDDGTGGVAIAARAVADLLSASVSWNCRDGRRPRFSASSTSRRSKAARFLMTSSRAL